MKFPIILVEPKSGHIAMYSETSLLERELEAVDIENGEFEVFDAEGRVLELEVEQGNGRYMRIFPWSIDLVTVVETERRAPETLRTRLIQFGGGGDQELVDLADLVYVVSKRVEYREA